MIKIISLTLMLLATPLIAQQTFNKLNVKELDVTSRVNVTSTTKASKPCPAMTETQRNAIVSPLSGSCIYNSTTLKLNVYNGSVWKAAGGGVDNWATASAYSVDDIVIESSKIYQCLIAHTSGTFATDLAALKWIEISAQGNLTGVITSTGLTTSISSQTGTGTKFVVDNTPTLITPVLGVASATSINGTTIPSSKTLETKDTLTTKGDIYAATAAASTDRLAVGADDQVLTADSTQATGLKWSSVGVTSQGLSEGSSVSTSTFRAPYNQLTTTVTGVRNIETGNGNMLVNPDFEGLASPTPDGWTCTVGTCTKTTTSGEFSSNLAALKVALSAQSMNVSQTITTPSGIQKQGVVGFIYRIPATGIVTPTVTVTVDSVLQVTVPTDKLIMDGLFHSLEVPILFGATDIKISFLSGSSTGSVFFDGVYVRQGIGFQNLQLDNVYSTTVSPTGVITNPSKSGWVTSCTNSGGVSTCQFATGLFPVTPNCTAIVNENSANVFALNTISTTAVTFQNNTVGTSRPYSLICQKSGNDYLAASSQVYSQASGNTNPTAFTPVLTGGASFSDEGSFWRREGKFLIVEGTGVITTPSATAFSVALPNGLKVDASVSSATTNSNALIGYIYRLAGTFTSTFPGTSYGPWTPFTDTADNDTLVYFARSQNGSRFLKAPGNDLFVTGERFRFSFKVPISGWSNSSVIVGSFENVPTVPGAGKKIDIFSVSYGTTNATTVCSVSPCSYLDQIGDAVSSITRSATGQYVLNVSKTYSKLKCLLNGSGAAGPLGIGSSSFSCASCSTLNFNTFNSVPTVNDSWGNISCQGTY